MITKLLVPRCPEGRRGHGENTHRETSWGTTAGRQWRSGGGTGNATLTFNDTTVVTVQSAVCTRYSSDTHLCGRPTSSYTPISGTGHGVVTANYLEGGHFVSIYVLVRSFGNWTTVLLYCNVASWWFSVLKVSLLQCGKTEPGCHHPTRASLGPIGRRLQFIPVPGNV